MTLKIYKNEKELSKKLALFIVNKIKLKNNLVIGCPSGRSLKKTYHFIGRLSYQKKIDLSRVRIFMMDEYVEKKTNYRLCKIESHYSCIGFAHRVIKKLFNYKKNNNHKLKSSNIFFPDVENPKLYDKFIKKIGGIDIFFLASGTSDGHVAFNNSYTSLNSSTHIIKLSNATRRDNLKTFPKFKSINDVPKFGVTVGLGTIYKNTKIGILVLCGKEKRKAAKKIIKIKKFNHTWPASIIYKCKKNYIYIDKIASSYK